MTHAIVKKGKVLEVSNADYIGEVSGVSKASDDFKKKYNIYPVEAYTLKQGETLGDPYFDASDNKVKYKIILPSVDNLVEQRKAELKVIEDEVANEISKAKIFIEASGDQNKETDLKKIIKTLDILRKDASKKIDDFESQKDVKGLSDYVLRSQTLKGFLAQIKTLKKS